MAIAGITSGCDQMEILPTNVLRTFVIKGREDFLPN